MSKRHSLSFFFILILYSFFLFSPIFNFSSKSGGNEILALLFDKNLPRHSLSCLFKLIIYSFFFVFFLKIEIHQKLYWK